MLPAQGHRFPLAPRCSLVQHDYTENSEETWHWNMHKQWECSNIMNMLGAWCVRITFSIHTHIWKTCIQSSRQDYSLWLLLGLAVRAWLLAKFKPNVSLTHSEAFIYLCATMCSSSASGVLCFWCFTIDVFFLFPRVSVKDNGRRDVHYHKIRTSAESIHSCLWTPQRVLYHGRLPKEKKKKDHSFIFRCILITIWSSNSVALTTIPINNKSIHPDHGIWLWLKYLWLVLRANMLRKQRVTVMNYN